MKDFSKFKLIISQEEIRSKINQIAEIIDTEYQDKEITIIMIMKGSFIFVSDLVREIKTPFSLESIACSSCGKKGTKRVFNVKDLDILDLKDKHVLVIDDIFDSGKTLSLIMKEVLKKKPTSLKSLVMLVTKNPKRNPNIKKPNFYLFEIENKFVIGYGLDYKEYFRGLKGIYFIK